MTPRFRLVSDDDGHEYVIPADMRDEFSKWLDSEWAELGEVPTWADRLSRHRSNYTFTGWREEP